MSSTNAVGPHQIRSPQFFLDDPSHATRQELSKSLMEYGFRLIALAVLAMLKAEADGSAEDGGHVDNPWQRLDQLLQQLFSPTAGDAMDGATLPVDFAAGDWGTSLYAPPSPPSDVAPAGDGAGTPNASAPVPPHSSQAPAKPQPPKPADATTPQAGKPADSSSAARPHPSASAPSSEAVRKPHQGQLPPDPTEIVDVGKPIVVKAGEVFDGKGKYYRPTLALGDGGQSENQLPVFILEPGATLKNVQYSGADGIHLLGDAKLVNILNRDVGEDAITVSGEGQRLHDAKLAGFPPEKRPSRPAEVEIINSSFYHAHDKVVQVNGDADISLKGVYANDVGQVMVTNGGKPITANVKMEDSVFEDVHHIVFRSDSRTSSIRFDNVDTPNDALWAMMGDRRRVSGTESIRNTPDPV